MTTPGAGAVGAMGAALPELNLFGVGGATQSDVGKYLQGKQDYTSAFTHKSGLAIDAITKTTCMWTPCAFA